MVDALSSAARVRYREDRILPCQRARIHPNGIFRRCDCARRAVALLTRALLPDGSLLAMLGAITLLWMLVRGRAGVPEAQGDRTGLRVTSGRTAQSKRPPAELPGVVHRGPHWTPGYRLGILKARYAF